MTRSGEALDDPRRGSELRARIRSKPALSAWYGEAYRRYAECLARTPGGGIALELGSGAGFAKEQIPELLTSDVLPYERVDQILEATAMPFRAASLRFIGMLNVFHHIPDPAAFLEEAQRCLMPGGRMLIVDQHRGLISAPILTYAHHEPFRPDAEAWQFDSRGPLSGANGALTWIVFKRDVARFRRDFPDLELVRYRTHSPLRYWLAGGLKPWSLIGRRTFPLASAVDAALSTLAPALGSFVDVEIRRR